VKVVSDTSPICYLLLIDEIDLLASLFGSILVPEAVAEELSHSAAPEEIRDWVAKPPAWLEVRRLATDPGSSSDELIRLHRGEREAIHLAEEVSADLLLVDERQARRVANNRGLEVAGLVGVLDRAASQGLVDLRAAVTRLATTNFRVHPELLEHLLRRHP
jgi:predicted nucleic acid-binding protein